MNKRVLRTPLCDALNIDYPILLAGMGGHGLATPPKLVAAVSNAGGLGVMGGSDLTPEEIRRRVREIKSLTDKPFGVDLLLPVSMADISGTEDRQVYDLLEDKYPSHTAFVRELTQKHRLPSVPTPADSPVLAPDLIRRQVDVILEEQVPVFAAALGDPSWVVPMAKGQGMKVMGLVGSVRHAQRQVKAGVDFVIAQGYEAGGHTGRIATFALLPQVVDAASPTPVIAAGGIGDGRGLVAALALGAVGVWCGTLFLLAKESDLYAEHKSQIANGVSEDFIVTRAYTGKTARDYRNVVIEAWEDSELDPLPMPLQGALMKTFVAAAAKAGKPELINNPAGQLSGMLKEQKSASVIVEEMVEEALDTLATLRRKIKAST